MKIFRVIRDWFLLIFVGRSTKSPRRVFPVKSPAVRQTMARKDSCPECGGELDTGWECNDCGFDARNLVYPEWERNADKKHVSDER